MALPPVPPCCWFCQTIDPPPTGWARINARPGHSGTRVPICAEGEGHRDGRVRHGPLADPHWPDEPCQRCKDIAPSEAARR